MFYNSVDTGQILEQFEKNVELGGSGFFYRTEDST